MKTDNELSAGICLRLKPEFSEFRWKLALVKQKVNEQFLYLSLTIVFPNTNTSNKINQIYTDRTNVFVQQHSSNREKREMRFINTVSYSIERVGITRDKEKEDLVANLYQKRWTRNLKFKF